MSRNKTASPNTDRPQVIPIDQSDDPRLSVFADLRHAHARPNGEYFVAEGRLVVNRLIASEYPVVSILVQQGIESEYAGRLGADVPVYSLPRDRLQELVGFSFHRGVIACARRLPLRPIDRFGENGCVGVSLALLGITEADNMGHICRTAAALGVNRVLLGPGTVDPFSRRVLRVSMANVLKHHFYRLDEPIGQFAALKKHFAVRTVASTVERDATPIDQFACDERPIILLLGNEAEGIDLELQYSADDRVTIPMHRGVDSLNVSIANAILIYELTRSACK